MSPERIEGDLTYRNLTEILDAKKHALAEIVRAAASLDAAQQGFRPAGGGWSVGDVVAHLALVESSMIRLIATLAGKAETATGPNKPLHSYEVSLEPHLERSRTEKYRTRDNFVPGENVSVTDSLKVLENVQAELLNLRPRLELVDPTLVRFPHWIFGPLDLAQWVAFVGIHEERHLGQIQAIIASEEFNSLP